MDTEDIAWEHIPTVVLTKIYSYLTVKDRLTASLACRNWRFGVFQVPLVSKLHLELKHGVEEERLQFLIDAFFWKLEYLTLIVDPNLINVWDLVHDILSNLEGSPKLKSLKIRFTENSFFSKCFNSRLQNNQAVVTRINVFRSLIRPILAILGSKNCLETFSCPLINELAVYNGKIFSALAENSRHWYTVSNLFLATFRIGSSDVPAPENTIRICQLLDTNTGIGRFSYLKMLSIDYDTLSDDVLARIGANNLSGGLKQISVVARRANSTVTNDGWCFFISQNPECKVRLTLVGPEVTMDHGSNLIMRSMPITHFRALYCRGLRVSCLNSLIRWNMSTLEHLELIHDNVGWMESILEGVPTENEEFLDPIIYASWRCENLRSIKISYRYHGESLIGIARLRGAKLMNLDVPKSQIACCSMARLSEEISAALGRTWTPSEDKLRSKPMLQKIFERSMQCFEADESSMDQPSMSILH